MTKLVLTRRIGESIKIGDLTAITIKEVHAKKVYIDCNGSSYWLALDDGYTFTDPVCTFTVCAINRGVVKLLFEAERAVNIVRTELLK